MSQAAIHRSYWLNEEPLQPRFDRLSGVHTTEILILGAGISGLSIAAELLARGHRVTICEAETIGAGTTGGSSGHLDAHPEMGCEALIRHLGEQDAREYVGLRLAAIRKIQQRGGANCAATVPAYYYSESAKDESKLRSELEAARRVGLSVQWADSIPLPQAQVGYRIEDMGRLDCMRYLRRLTDHVVEQGGQIFEQTLVSGPTESHPKELEASGGTIRFEHVVCAVHCNFTDSMRLYLETPAYQSYVLAARVANPPPDALFWDNSDPYYYVRRVGPLDQNLVLIGGRDHRTGAGDELKALEQLEQWARHRFQVEEIRSRWSAELFEPVDRLPLIGKVANKSNVWIATGLSGVGLTLGTAAGEIIADGIDGAKTSSLLEKLSPARFGMGGAATMAGEQLTAAASFAERILPAETIDPSQLRAGEGRVGKVDGEFVAICRDHQGCEHRHSPICSHMGGVVRWNAAEQTWDCPVHGGRFTAAGKRLYGPPESELEDVQSKSSK